MIMDGDLWKVCLCGRVLGAMRCRFLLGDHPSLPPSPERQLSVVTGTAVFLIRRPSLALASGVVLVETTAFLRLGDVIHLSVSSV
jgi:hypothetical protein